MVVGGRDPVEVAAAAIRGGADVIQWRDKTGSTRLFLETAGRLLSVARKAGKPLIINDRVDVARGVCADGVHLGQDDLPVASAREILGNGAIIGKSTHSLEQALEAEREGVDYIGLGPIFRTPTKPEYESVGLALVSQVARRARLPFVCIGGIDQTNVESVLRSGSDRIAIVRAVCAAADPESATRALKQSIAQSVRESKSAPV